MTDITFSALAKGLPMLFDPGSGYDEKVIQMIKGWRTINICGMKGS